MSNFSREEVNGLLTQLIEKLSDVLANNEMFANDFYLYRWLIHNQMKVERTESRIRKSIAWRQEVNYEELVEREFAYFAPGLETELVVDMQGFTNTGNPLTIINGDGINLRAIIRKYGKDNLVRYYFQMYAKLEQRMMDFYKKNIDVTADSTKSKDSYTNIRQTPSYDPSWDSIANILVLSYKDFSLLNATSAGALQATVDGSTAGMTCFPAMVSTVYFINLNSITNLVLKVLKPILNSRVMKLEFYDTDKSKWSKDLLELHN